MKNRAEIMFVILLLFFIAGIGIAYQYPCFTFQNCIEYIGIALFVALFVLNLNYLKLRIYKRKILTSILLYLMVFAIGIWVALKNHDPIQPGYFAKVKTDYLRVIIDEEPQIKGDYIRFNAKVRTGYHKHKSLACDGKMLVSIRLDTQQHRMNFNYGDELLLPSRYTIIPAVQNPGEFDYAGWLATKNVFHQTYIPENEVVLLRHAQGSAIKAFVLKLRKRQINILKDLFHQPEALSVASTLILGYRSDLDKETLAAYSKTGTIHVLSVSGMHVGIIYMVLTTLLAFLDRRQATKLLKALLIIALIWFYSAITGFSPSVLRSALMLSCFIVAKSLNRRSNSYNILAFSAFILLINEPLLLYDVGFQLSYCAVWGLIFLQPLIYAKWYVKNWLADRLWQLISLSLAAQLATLPLSVYYFHQFPVYFLLSNLFVMLPAALIMYLGFAILLFRFFFLTPLLEYLIIFTNAMLKWIAQLPYSTLSSIWITKVELFLLILFLGLFMSCLQRLTKNRLALTLSALLSLQIALGYRQLQAHQQRRIITFKLKRNYAKAYLYANQAIIYTDIAPESPVFQYSIKPCLEKHLITEVQIKIPHQQLKKLKHL